MKAMFHTNPPNNYNYDLRKNEQIYERAVAIVTCFTPHHFYPNR